MTAKQVMAEIRKVLGKYEGDESELLELLLSEADAWSARLEELQEDE